MKREKIAYLFIFAAFILLVSCHPRHLSDIKPNMTKDEVAALWGKTDLITYKTVDGKTLETWEYHFLNTHSICLVTFSQDRVVHTQCRQRPYAYYYPYYYPYPYPYPYYYPYYSPYGP